MRNQRVWKKQRQAAVVATLSMGLEEEKKPASWTKPFEHGAVRVLYYVNKNPIRNDYRFLVTNRGYRKDEEQWNDIEQIPNALRALLDLQSAHKKTKRNLEGGLLRRVIKMLF